MKILIFLALIHCFGHIAALGRGDLEKYGPFAMFLKVLKCPKNKVAELDVSGIKVYFYDLQTGSEQSFPASEAAQKILSIPKLDKAKNFIIWVSGYKSGIDQNTEARVRTAFSGFPNTYLIIIDHSPYTNNKPGMKKGYERSVTYVYSIGKKIAQVLAGLNKGGISADKMRCIGHSLGSQILGYTGDLFFKATGQKFSRITALDPAGPCFSNSLIQDQIRAGVAKYVEVYHCNAGGFGTASVLADVDFFVNKGNSQPNCGTPLIPGVFDSPKAATCGHKACVITFLASVAHRDWFPAFKCNKYKDFSKNKCAKNDKTIAGFWNPGTAKGVYYFSTLNYKYE